MTATKGEILKWLQQRESERIDLFVLSARPIKHSALCTMHCEQSSTVYYAHCTRHALSGTIKLCRCCSVQGHTVQIRSSSLSSWCKVFQVNRHELVSVVFSCLPFKRQPGQPSGTRVQHKPGHINSKPAQMLEIFIYSPGHSQNVGNLPRIILSPALIASRIICEKVADQGGPASRLDDQGGHKVDKLTKVDDQRPDCARCQTNLSYLSRPPHWNEQLFSTRSFHKKWHKGSHWRLLPEEIGRRQTNLLCFQFCWDGRKAKYESSAIIWNIGWTTNAAVLKSGSLLSD